MEWNDEVITRLRSLWDEGLSTAEIGRKLGTSKNAVVGKAHRLGLPARPSPIRREASGRARRPAARRITGPTLPPFAAAANAPADLPPPPRARPADPAPPPVIRAVVAPYGRVAACCWPIGEPGTASFRFCDAGSVPGKPYCSEHAQLAYVKVRDRREEAA